MDRERKKILIKICMNCLSDRPMLLYGFYYFQRASININVLSNQSFASLCDRPAAHNLPLFLSIKIIDITGEALYKVPIFSCRYRASWYESDPVFLF